MGYRVLCVCVFSSSLLSVYFGLGMWDVKTKKWSCFFFTADYLVYGSGRESMGGEGHGISLGPVHLPPSLCPYRMCDPRHILRHPHHRKG